MASEPNKVAIIVTVHCTTSGEAAKASELLGLAVSGLALEGINARMRMQPHEPNGHRAREYGASGHDGWAG